MKIIPLTETQFKNYSRLHSNRNYLQSVEYAKMQEKYGFSKFFLALSDDNDNIMAATLILSKKVFSKFSYGICPGGFLINYNDFDLLKNFNDLLREYLVNLDFIYLQVEPRCIIKSTNKSKNNIFTNPTIIKNLSELNIINVNNNINNKYAIYLNSKDEKNLYKNFSRSTRRTIVECKNIGISIYKGNIDNLNIFYKLISMKTNNPIDYYQDYLEFFDNPNNQYEIYFAKLSPQIYLNNMSVLLAKEQKINENINNKIKNLKNIPSTLLNVKIASDKRVQKYNMKLKDAINLFDKTKEDIIISTCSIIKNNKEITFLIDGYDDNFRNVRASTFIRYEIIRKYIKEGYNNFNLGFLPNVDETKTNNIYTTRISFGANLVEFPSAYHLVINKFLYNMPIVTKSQIRID